MPMNWQLKFNKKIFKGFFFSLNIFEIKCHNLEKSPTENRFLCLNERPIVWDLK